MHSKGPAKRFKVTIKWSGKLPAPYQHPVLQVRSTISTLLRLILVWLQYAEKGNDVDDQDVLKALDGPFSEKSRCSTPPSILHPHTPTTYTFRINEVSSRHNYKSFRLCFRCTVPEEPERQVECFTSGISVKAKKSVPFIK